MEAVEQKTKKQNILPGYKMTPVGIIPEDWSFSELANLGSTFTGLSGKDKDDFGKGKPYIPYKNIFQNSRIDLAFLELVNISESEKQNCVKYGDIFFTTSSESPEELGMSSVLLDEVNDLYLNSFCFGIRLKTFDVFSPLFARFLFRGEYIRKNIICLAQGSTRFNLSKSELLKVLIPLPPLPEQQKIADILSTWDKDIENIQGIIDNL
ncbi:MAG: restriction endonuclease subunit S, partial [Cytophagaceae bacterium]